MNLHPVSECLLAATACVSGLLCLLESREDDAGLRHPFDRRIYLATGILLWGLGASILLP